MYSTISRYLTDDYLNNNPSWDIEDSSWKANLVKEIFDNAGLQPQTICDIGCGAGEVLVVLNTFYKNAELSGFDIAPKASEFWKLCNDSNIKYTLGDFFEHNKKHYDVILLLDVIEHLSDPVDFIRKLHKYSNYIVCHIPLDLSAVSVLRESPLLHARKKVGHIHYFTKNLAFAMLKEADCRILLWRYTGAFSRAPSLSLITRIASFPRKLVFAFNKDWGVRLLGGETIIVLTKARYK